MSEPDKPKRKFWQIHLLTAVVVMVQVGWLIPALIDTYHYMNSVFIIGAGFGCFLVAVTTVILELCLRRLKRRILQFVVALLIVLTVALAAQLGKAVLSVVVISQNHQRATTACINFAGAEEVFHRSDYVGGGWSFYAQTLNQLYKGEGRPYASPLIDDSFSRAEFNSGVPKDGYLFKVLTAQGPHMTCSPKTEPGVMRVLWPFEAGRDFHETEEAQPGADHRQAEGRGHSISHWRQRGADLQTA